MGIYGCREAVASSLRFVPPEIAGGGKDLVRFPRYVYETAWKRDMTVVRIGDALHMEMKGIDKLAVIVGTICSELLKPQFFQQIEVDGSDELSPLLDELGELERKNSRQERLTCCLNIIAAIDASPMNDKRRLLKRNVSTLNALYSIQLKFFQLSESARRVVNIAHFSNLMTDVIEPIERVHKELEHYLDELVFMATFPNWEHLNPAIEKAGSAIGELKSFLKMHPEKYKGELEIPVHSIPVIRDLSTKRVSESKWNEDLSKPKFERVAENLMDQISKERIDALKNMSCIEDWDKRTPFEPIPEVMTEGKELDLKSKQRDQWDNGPNALMAIVDLPKSRVKGESSGAGELILPKVHGLFSDLYLKKRQMQLERVNINKK